MNYVLSILIIGLLIFMIVKNVIGVVNKIKERKSQKDNDIVQVEVKNTSTDDIDNNK